MEFKVILNDYCVSRYYLGREGKNPGMKAGMYVARKPVGHPGFLRQQSLLTLAFFINE